MKINPISIAEVSRAQLFDARAVDNSSPPKPTPPAQSAAVTSPSVTSLSPLSAETRKDLTFAMQQISPHDEHTHKIPPAQQARAALADNPDLGNRPFGAIVSRIARGEPLPTSDSSSQPNEPVPSPVSDELTNVPPDDPVIEDQAPTGVDLLIEVLANPPENNPVIEEALDLLAV